LAFQRQHKDGVYFRNIAVQRDITPRVATDDQLAFFLLGGAADERVVFEHGDGLDDFPDAIRHVLDFVLRQMFEDAIDVLADLRRQLDVGHVQRPSLRAAGRATVLPASRSSR